MVGDVISFSLLFFVLDRLIVLFLTRNINHHQQTIENFVDQELPGSRGVLNGIVREYLLGLKPR